MTRIIFILFFYQSVFSQNEKDQIEMETTTLMNVPMMGTITTSVKSYASDKSFKKDNNIEIDKFYTRMMMGGNKRNGIILNGETKMRTVFDLEEREYTVENFQSIIDNNGIPKTKDITNPFSRDNRNNNNSDNDSKEEDDTEESDEDDNEDNGFKILDRNIFTDKDKLNGFSVKKIITSFGRKSGSKMITTEWITTDTALISFVLEKEMELVESYKGKRSNASMVMSSDRMIKSIDPNYEYEEVPGKVVKSKMENFNDDGKSAFSMVWEIKSIKKKSYNSNDFVVGKKLKKVENFE